ncbi:unnamed protein product [Symbiodinium sp. CCMP2456]|nr:unnamed protein product [Symbiodinium sp. CCMP2456]
MAPTDHYAAKRTSSTTGITGTPLRLNPSWLVMWFGANLRVRTFLLHAHETMEEFQVSMEPSTASESWKTWLRAQLVAVHPATNGDQGSNAELAKIIKELLQEP